MWVNSKRAAEILGVNNKSLIQAIYRAEKSAKKFCSIKCNILHFTRTDGNRGGASGKTLQIWLDDDLINDKNGEILQQDALVAAKDAEQTGVSAPGARELSAKAEQGVECGGANLNGAAAADPSAGSNALSSSTEPSSGGARRDLNGAEQSSSDPSSATSLPAIAVCSDKKRKAAFEKYDVIKAWEDAKGKISEAAFLEYINAKKICCVKVTANKLYDWQRKFKRGGLDALVDERDNNKTLKLDALGLAPLCVELILACSGMGKVDITNIYKALNYHAVKNSLINFEDFQGKKDEVVSYEVVNRFVNNYLNKNKLVKNIILYGEDGAVGRGLPALGISNYAASTINEVVEIDGSPLDLICNASELCEMIGWQNVSTIFKDKDEFQNYVKEWQKRYTIIALIDTYSGVATFHISDSENSLSIARAVAKYIVRYGKPKVIKGDNGKAFKSEYMREVLGALEIEYKAVRAYSGWLKPYVERNFRALQHSFSANLAGFIGHNISQRQAIEFFRSKKERRLKRGYKTNLTMLKNLSEVQELMDMYAEKFLNTRYLERLDTTCAAAYSTKINDAEHMDALSISARLGGRELKHVHKKGISLDGVRFYSVEMYGLERVWVSKNVNNINECFLWSEDNKFIGVASTLDLDEGVSAEEAKSAQKLFNRRLKETKKQMDAASIAHRADFEQIVRIVEAKPAAMPKPQAANNESRLIDAALKGAKSLNSNAALSDE
uniref:integrase catalytic domain-containing protein n=1 Tax=uncultured Campylobacter sp. TaxID=218934 RepID=UPI00262C818E